MKKTYLVSYLKRMFHHIFYLFYYRNCFITVFSHKKQILKNQPNSFNYFYAEFLTEERDYKAAMSYIEKAKQAAPRPDRISADQGRLQEIAALEAKVAKKLKR